MKLFVLLLVPRLAAAQFGQPEGEFTAVAVLEGEAGLEERKVEVALRSHTERALWTYDLEVQEEVRLAPGHEGVVLGIGDSEALDAEVERIERVMADVEDVPTKEWDRIWRERLQTCEPEPYTAASWTLRNVRVRIDGHPTPARHASWPLDHPKLGWDGAWIVSVPKGARSVQFSYGLRPWHMQSYEGAAQYDGASAAATWKGGGRFRMEWRGLEPDLPAFHVQVRIEPVGKARWRLAAGTLSIRSDDGVPAQLAVAWPATRCERADGFYFPCLGVMAASEDQDLSEWAEQAERGWYEPRALRLARNWLYAWHGRPFRSKDLRSFFGTQPWYEPDPAYTDERLSPQHRAAIERIREVERRQQTAAGK